MPTIEEECCSDTVPSQSNYINISKRTNGPYSCSVGNEFYSNHLTMSLHAKIFIRDVGSL
jgi:hypothetical protein